MKRIGFNKPYETQLPVETKADLLNTSISPNVHNIQKPLGKRAQIKLEVWEPVRNAARALWAENNQLTIADVIRRIKMMNVFKASAFSESAIRKHINKLAPLGANKAGRRSNKFT